MHEEIESVVEAARKRKRKSYTRYVPIAIILLVFFLGACFHLYSKPISQDDYIIIQALVRETAYQKNISSQAVWADLRSYEDTASIKKLSQWRAGSARDYLVGQIKNKL